MLFKVTSQYLIIVCAYQPIDEYLKLKGSGELFIISAWWRVRSPRGCLFGLNVPLRHPQTLLRMSINSIAGSMVLR